jgi:hypothetical protein
VSGSHRGPARWWRRKRDVEPAVDMDPYMRRAKVFPIRPTELEVAQARRALLYFPLGLDVSDPELPPSVLAVLAYQQHAAAQVLDGALRQKEEDDEWLT